MFLPIWEEHFLFKPFVANNCAPASPLFIRAFIHSCIRGKQMRACEPTHIRTLTHLLHQLPATSHLSEHPHSQDWKDSVWTLISVPPPGYNLHFLNINFSPANARTTIDIGLRSLGCLPYDIHLSPLQGVYLILDFIQHLHIRHPHKASEFKIDVRANT